MMLDDEENFQEGKSNLFKKVRGILILLTLYLFVGNKSPVHVGNRLA